MTASNIIGNILFSGVGFVAFIYGKKTDGFRKMMLGLTLMVYPYLITNTVWMYVVGVLLTAALFIP